MLQLQVTQLTTVDGGTVVIVQDDDTTTCKHFDSINPTMDELLSAFAAHLQADE